MVAHSADLGYFLFVVGVFGGIQNRCNIKGPLWLLFIFLSFEQSSGLSDELSVEIFPTDIQLSVGAQQRLLISHHSESGFIEDLSRKASITTSNRAVVTVENGLVRGEGEGLAKIRVEVNSIVRNVDVVVVPSVGGLKLSFVGDVLPVLAKAGCAGGSCHAKPKGQNGFSLSVFSHDPESDYREVVKDQRGRRVFPALPSESLLLKKPTLKVEHEGGRRFAADSFFYSIIHRWIEEGMLYKRVDEPILNGIDVFPLERRYSKSSYQQLVVTANFSDGSSRDVSHLAEFSSNEKDIVEINSDGLLRVGGLNGEGVIVVRYQGKVALARVIVPADSSFPDYVYDGLPKNNFIDEQALVRFRKLGILPSDLCTDSEFIRRAYIDTLGVLPLASEVRLFLSDQRKNKRNGLINRLLDDPRYADTWANRWGDLFRPNIARVGLKSAYTIDDWIRRSFAENKPYDQMAREILTAKGSTHKVGPTVIYRTRREPATLTTLFSQVFLGVRLECARCHHHPNEKWSQGDFYSFAAFFAELKRKGTGISPPISAGTEYFYHSPGGDVKHPVTGEIMTAAPLGAAKLITPSGKDPRSTLANWMLVPDNPYFAKAMVNRIWGQFFGRGIVHPVDDFRASNPPVNPDILDALANDFSNNGYDLKHLMRRIMESRLYQLSSIPNKTNLQDTRSFSRFYRRRFSAENLEDIIEQVTGVTNEYSNLRSDARKVELWTTKMDSPLLESFGLPNSSENCPCERDNRSSIIQALHLMNSSDLQLQLANKNGHAAKMVKADHSPSEIVDEVYLMLYSRWPTEEEKVIAVETIKSNENNRQQGVEDLMWALINTGEFVFNH